MMLLAISIEQKSFIRWHYDFLKKFLQRVGKWLLADTIPNFTVQ